MVDACAHDISMTAKSRRAFDKNKAEVELGKFTADEAEHKDVKEFAEKMAKTIKWSLTNSSGLQARMNRATADRKSNIESIDVA